MIKNRHCVIDGIVLFRRRRRRRRRGISGILETLAHTNVIYFIPARNTTRLY